MFPHHQGSQGSQLPTHWQPPTAQQPANGSYAHHPPPPQPPAQINTSLPPPPAPQEPRPDMAAHHHHQQQPPYRLPGPHEWTRAAPPPAPYAGHPVQQPPQPPPPPPPQNYMTHAAHAAHQPPAPRQRTAIACRYCRRRKIRCSGFENTDDGRCSNCMRFNQDCIFTPVSAQTQAFVPAHTVWRGVGAPPPMYGAYGQPLQPAASAAAAADPFAQAPRQPHYLPSPTGSASTASPYPAAPPLPAAAAADPYYTHQPPRQASPQGSYTTSSSPHGYPPGTTAASSPYYPSPSSTNGLQPTPARSEGRTPPPAATSQAPSRPGMRINDLVSDNGRSSTDSDMLRRLL